MPGAGELLELTAEDLQLMLCDVSPRRSRHTSHSSRSQSHTKRGELVVDAPTVDDSGAAPQVRMVYGTPIGGDGNGEGLAGVQGASLIDSATLASVSRITDSGRLSTSVSASASSPFHRGPFVSASQFVEVSGTVVISPTTTTAAAKSTRPREALAPTSKLASEPAATSRHVGLHTLAPVTPFCGLHTAAGERLIPLTDAEIITWERRRRRRTVQECWFHRTQHYLCWDETFLRCGSTYRTNTIAARTTVTMTHTKALCLSMNIDPQLLSNVEGVADSSDEDDGGGGGVCADGYGLFMDNGSAGRGASRSLPPLYTWQAPASIHGDANTVLVKLGEELQEQYNTFAPQRPLPTYNNPNPRPADLGLALSEARKEAGDAKVIFHYVARGVPCPRGGTIYLMNSSVGAGAYSPYSKMALDTFRSRVGFPLVFVADVSDAGEIMRDFLWKREEQEQRQQFLSREHQLKSSRQVSSAELDLMVIPDGTGGGSNGSLSGMPGAHGVRRAALGLGSSSGATGGSGGGVGMNGVGAAGVSGVGGNGSSSPPSRIYEDFFFIGASGIGEGGPGSLPHHPRLPSDILSSCLTTPVRLAMLWYMVGRPDLREVHPVLLHLLPGAIADKKTPLGQLQWYLQTITECIAWSTLPLQTYSRLFREDIYVAPLFRGYLLAERVVVGGLGGTLSVYPPLPPTHAHAMWDVWDNLVERCCVAVLANIRPAPPTRLTALETREWLDARATRWKYEQEQVRRDLWQQYRLEGMHDEAAAAAAGMGAGPRPTQLLPLLRNAQVALPNFFHEELRGVAALVERVTQQSLRLPGALLQGMTATPAMGSFGVNSGNAAARCGGRGTGSGMVTGTGRIGSVFAHLAPHAGTAELANYRNTSLQYRPGYYDALDSSMGAGDGATAAGGGGAAHPTQAMDLPSPMRAPQRSGGSGPSGGSLSRTSGPGRGDFGHMGAASGCGYRTPQALRGDVGGHLLAGATGGAKEEYVPNTFIQSPSGGDTAAYDCISGAGSGTGGASGSGVGAGVGGSTAAFPFVERAPVLLQGLLVLAHREKATELVCRLVDAGAPAILQCAETNMYRIVLDRYWSRADLRVLMPATLFIYCKSCYADPELIGPPRQRDMAIKTCVDILQCPVDVPFAADRDTTDGIGDHKGGATTAPPPPPGAWQHETLGPYASPTGQRLLAASLLAMLAMHSDDGREACHRVGALQVCCQLLAETISEPSLLDTCTKGGGGGTSGEPSSAIAEAGVLNMPLSLAEATTAAEAEELGVRVLYQLATVSLLLALLHSWSPLDSDGNPADENDSDEDDEQQQQQQQAEGMTAYWQAQLLPLDGEVKELPATDALGLKASLRVAHAALARMSYSVIPTLRGASAKALSMVIVAPSVDLHTREMYVSSLLERVYEERLSPFEGNVDLRLETVGTAYVVFRFFMEQLRTEMPLDEIRDWVAKWIYQWNAMRKNGIQPRQPYLRRKGGEQSEQEGLGGGAGGKRTFAGMPLGMTSAVNTDSGAIGGGASVEASDPLGRHTIAVPQTAAGMSVAPGGASKPPLPQPRRQATRAFTGTSLLEASVGYRSVSGSSRGYDMAAWQPFERYLPPLSNVVRLFLEHAEDNCPHVVAHVRKVVLEDFAFLQVPWFDQNHIEGYEGGTPPASHLHHRPSHMLPQTSSAAGATTVNAGARRPRVHLASMNHQSDRSGGGGVVGHRGELTPTHAPGAFAANPLTALAPTTLAGAVASADTRALPDMGNSAAHRHYVASLMHAVTARYVKGGHRAGGAAAFNSRYPRRLAGSSTVVSPGCVVGGGKHGESAVDVGVIVSADNGGNSGLHHARMSYWPEEHSAFHGFVGASRGTGVGDVAHAGHDTPDPAGAAAATAGSKAAAAGGTASTITASTAAATADPTANLASRLQSRFQSALEPENITLCALSGQDATTVVSAVYAALGYLGDLLLVRRDDFDPRGLYMLDKESALYAFLHRASAGLRASSRRAAATAAAAVATTTTVVAPLSKCPRLSGDASSSSQSSINNAGHNHPSGNSTTGTGSGHSAMPLPSLPRGPSGEGCASASGGGTAGPTANAGGNRGRAVAAVAVAKTTTHAGEGTVLEVAFHPTEPYFVTVTDHGFVHVWDYTSAMEAGARREASRESTAPTAPRHQAQRSSAPSFPPPTATTALKLLSCFRPSDIYGRVRSFAPAEVQLHYLYTPSSWTAGALPGGGLARRLEDVRTCGGWTATQALDGRDPLVAGRILSPVLGHGSLSSAHASGATGVYASSTTPTSCGRSGAVSENGGCVLSGNGVCGVHFVDAAYHTLLCTVRRSGSVELFASFTNPLALRRVTAFETMTMDVGARQHECLSNYQDQCGVLHVTAANGTVTSWDLAHECLSSAGYGRGDYPGVPTVLTSHAYNPHVFAVGAGPVYLYDRRERSSAHSSRTFWSPLAVRPNLGGLAGGDAAATAAAAYGSHTSDGGWLRDLTGEEAYAVCLDARFSIRYPHVLVAGYSGSQGPVLLWDDRMTRRPLHCYLTRDPAAGDASSSFGVSVGAANSSDFAPVSGADVGGDSGAATVVGDLSGVHHLAVQPCSSQMLTLSTTATSASMTQPFALNGEPLRGAHVSYEVPGQPSAAASHSHLPFFAVGSAGRVGLYCH